MAYQRLADAVLVLHFVIVLFVVGGSVTVVAGNSGLALGESLWFRLAHLAAVGVIVAQAWLGQVCPLTTVESRLRMRAGSPGYSKSFIEHWVQAVLFYEAPAWVFVLAYTMFGLLVLGTWWRFPPRRGHAWKNGA